MGGADHRNPRADPDDVKSINTPESAFTFHRLTKHGSGARDRSLLVDFQRMDPANRPAPFKRYLDLETRPLPTDFDTSDARAVEVLSGRVSLSQTRLDVKKLAGLLFFSAGITRTAHSLLPGTYFRAAMSAGNLHPVELYVVCGNLPSLPAGVHHFAPLEFGLTMLRSDDMRAALASAANAPEIAAAPCTIVLTGIPWRTAWKYGERGYRHLYWDAGTMLANLIAVADGYGFGARVLMGFGDDDVSRLVGVDGIEEFPLALAVVGSNDAHDAVARATVAPLDLAVAPVSAKPITFPLITATQQAGALADPQNIRACRAGAKKVAHITANTIDVPVDAPRPSIAEVILHRGSTRFMRHEEASYELLGWAMAVASRPVSGDFAPGDASLLEHYILVHAVAGLEPGAYRWCGGHLELQRMGDFRSVARRLCLNQSLGGDSAYTSFHCASLNEVLAACGSRGYRAAQLEAGVAAGRLSLAAFALGYGATGLTFFDDEVSAFFETSAATMLVTSVGVPAYRNTPGGLPGATPELTGFDRLMVKMRQRQDR